MSLTLKDLPEHEQLISCPYNKAHQVVAKRMAKHLVKCRRSHSTKGTKTCRFNISHVLPIEEFADHEETCPDRIVIELFAQQLKDSEKKKNEEDSKTQEEEASIRAGSAISILTSKMHLHDENWDDDNCTGSYDPKEATKHKALLRHVQHGLPSEMKKMRQENRLKNRKILNEIDALVKKENEKRAKITAESETDDEEKELMEKRALTNPFINWNYAAENYSRK